MKRLLLTAICTLSASPVCADSRALAAGMDFMLSPWVTAALLFVGMMLLITEMMSLTSWGASGTAGVACLGLVFATHAFAGTYAWLGAVLMLVGLGLLIVESRVIPGFGVSAVAGLASLFVGCYWMLSGAAGTLVITLISVMFTLMAAVAFLVHLPGNAAWRAIGRQVNMTVGHPYAVRFEGEEVETSGALTEEKADVESTRAEDKTQTDDQQTLGHS